MKITFNEEGLEFLVLLMESFKRNQDAFNELIKRQFKDENVQILQKVFVALVKLGKQQEKIYYSELAKEANLLYPKTKKVPEIGGSLGKQLGSVLGFLSCISWSIAKFPISVLVVQKFGGEQGEGYIKLLKNVLKIADPTAHTNAFKASARQFCDILMP